MEEQVQPSTTLDLAAAAVRTMWAQCGSLGSVTRASANDTIHFLHEEASEVVKCAMHMGYMGDKAYYRSEDARTTEWTWDKLLTEIGDVLLMALTLAESFDVNPSVCLQLSLDKFYARAAAAAMDNTCIGRCGPTGPLSPGHVFEEPVSIYAEQDQS